MLTKDEHRIVHETADALAGKSQVDIFLELMVEEAKKAQVREYVAKHAFGRRVDGEAKISRSQAAQEAEAKIARARAMANHKNGVRPQLGLFRTKA